MNTKTDFDDLSASPDRKLPAFIIGGSIIFLLLVLLIAWQVGVLDAPRDSTDATRLSSVLVILGVVVAQSVAIVAALLSHVSEANSHRLAVYEQKRLASESIRNSERLRHDSVISGVALLSTSDGGHVPAAQQAAVMNALVSLGSPDVAIYLLSDRWSATDDEQVSVVSAVNVIDQVLSSDRSTPATKEQATHLLLKHATDLLVLNDDRTLVSFRWPSRLGEREWGDDLSPQARSHVVIALEHMMVDWKKREEKRTRWESTIGSLLLAPAQAADDAATRDHALKLLAALQPLLKAELGTEIAQLNGLPAIAELQGEYALLADWARAAWLIDVSSQTGDEPSLNATDGVASESIDH